MAVTLLVVLGEKVHKVKIQDTTHMKDFFMNQPCKEALVVSRSFVVMADEQGKFTFVYLVEPKSADDTYSIGYRYLTVNELPNAIRTMLLLDPDYLKRLTYEPDDLRTD